MSEPRFDAWTLPVQGKAYRWHAAAWDRKRGKVATLCVHEHRSHAAARKCAASVARQCNRRTP